MRGVNATKASSAWVSLIIAGLLPVPATAQNETAETLRAGSRAPYVHRISLYDEHGVTINPRNKAAAPYSPRATCGKCHDYATISSGWHFNALAPATDSGRPGEPWILTDAFTGTQVPVSARAWSGTYRPHDLGMTAWRFATLFGRHLPGGGMVEPDAKSAAQVPQGARWRVSGNIEIDCMVCHSADTRHDPSEASRQIEKENFRWIATATLGLAVVRGEARKAPDDWDPLLPPDPDFPERTGPSLLYDTSRFDADDRVFFDITRKPSSRRCYFCHTVREAEGDAPEAWALDWDVHLKAGLGCTDCHRHGLDHMMVRGYESERTPGPRQRAQHLTCRGCHLGGDAEMGAPPLAGGLGAPRPVHGGLPPLHLEKLTCPACHAGAWPTGRARRMQTAMAHGLGIASKERTDSTSPEIWGPVFMRGGDGKIGPYRMVWPAFWGEVDGGVMTPLSPAGISAAMRKALPNRPSGPQSVGLLGVDDISHVLAVLEAESPQLGDFVYVQRGGLHLRTPTGEVATYEHPAALPYYWPIGHDVRPAVQSLGSGGCMDCHAADSPFSFGRVVPETGEQTERPPVEFMYELQGKSPLMLRIWAWPFALRLAFKIVGFACAGVLASVLIVYGLAAVSSLMRMGARPPIEGRGGGIGTHV